MVVKAVEEADRHISARIGTSVLRRYTFRFVLAIHT